MSIRRSGRKRRTSNNSMGSCLVSALTPTLSESLSDSRLCGTCSLRARLPVSQPGCLSRIYSSVEGMTYRSSKTFHISQATSRPRTTPPRLGLDHDRVTTPRPAPADVDSGPPAKITKNTTLYDGHTTSGSCSDRPCCRYGRGRYRVARARRPKYIAKPLLAVCSYLYQTHNRRNADLNTASARMSLPMGGPQVRNGS